MCHKLSCCRSALAASHAQAQLQGAAEAAAEDLQTRIAEAEAAVAEAEQAAQEAAGQQLEAAKAAKVASGHASSASVQADTAVQVSAGPCRTKHSSPDPLYFFDCLETYKNCNH